MHAPRSSRPDGVRWTYAELTERANRYRARAGRRSRSRPGQPRAAARAEHACDGRVLVRGDQGWRHRRAQRCRCCVRRSWYRSSTRRGSRMRFATRALPASWTRRDRPARRSIACCGSVIEASTGDGIESRARVKPATFDDVGTAADDTALIAFTSGTTGMPKGTMHFHRDVHRDLRLLAALDARGIGGRPVHRQPAARVHVRARRPAAVPAAHRRRDAAARDARRRRRCCRPSQQHRPTVLFTAPTSYRAMAGARRELRPVEPAQVRVGRRSAAGGDAQAVEGGDRHRDHRRHRRHRDAAHLHLAPRRRRPPRCDRQAGARLRGLRHGRRGSSRYRRARSGASRSRDRPAAATWTTRASRPTSRTAGTTPATRTGSTRTAGSSTRRAPTT